MTRYITREEATAINFYLIERYSPGEQKGIKSPYLLDSAIMRPQTSAFGEEAYGSIFEKAAALFESLSQNHPFQNANKRTAFAALLQFLRYNGYTYKMDQLEAVEFTVNVVTHKYNFREIVELIEKHSFRY